MKSQEAANWGSALLVIVASAIVGRQAAVGMEPSQWACAAVAVLGAVSVAVMVRVWPSQQKARAED